LRVSQEGLFLLVIHNELSRRSLVGDSIQLGCLLLDGFYGRISLHGKNSGTCHPNSSFGSDDDIWWFYHMFSLPLLQFFVAANDLISMEEATLTQRDVCTFLRS